MEEEEICRVCRGEGTVEEPLYYPCKCSGSIRFVHQECLMDWLSHSKKKYCELCNYYYKFTPIYKNDMPASIPKRIFIGHFKSMLCVVTKWTLRASLVAFIWLGVVPYFAVWIWRFYFWNTDATSYLFSKLFSPSILQNTTLSTSSHQSREQENVWKNVMLDCLQGWLISTVVTTVFIAGFLLREWVLQNVPTELHEMDEEEEQAEEEAVVEPIDRPELPEAAVVPEEVLLQQQEHVPRVRRGRINNARRPPLVQEPSDYENLEAMWLMDEAQASPPLHRRGNRAGRDPFDLDQDSEQDDDGGEDDDGYFDESEEDEPVHPERVREILDTIQRHQQQQQQQEQQQQQQQQEQANIPNDQVVMDAVDVHVAPVDGNVHQNQANGVAGGPEDIDGLLEIIGMKGSIYMLFQNSGLMTLLMSLCLGAGVWVPYTMGVVFITIRPWEGVLLLTDLVRSLSDPILDGMYDLWLDFYTQLGPVAQWIPSWTPTVIKSIMLTAIQIGQTLITFFSTGMSHTNVPIASNDNMLLMDPATVQSYSVSLWYDIISFWNYIKPLYQSSFAYFVQMPTGDTAMDRAGCIATGYIVLVVIGSMYLSKTRSMYARIGRTASRQIIRQLGILLKVAFFVFMELTVFPLGCGLLLDCVALSLFYKIGGGGGAAGHLLAIHKRMTFLKENVASSIFMHWVIGTGFMFLFTTMVTFCRDIVRPGVIWFIRDPNDPQFSPIKELVKRPVFAQLQKICLSALIYGFVIEFGVGGLVAAIGAIFDGILPLKWSYTQPLTTIPIDLLVVMLVVPAMVDYFDPKQALEKTMTRLTTWLCHQLRLTSFLLGGRPINEEGYIYYKTWRAWIQRPELKIATLYHQDAADDSNNDNNDDADLTTFIRNGILVRAPKHDGARYVPGRRMLVPVDPITLEALDPTERSLGHPAVAAVGTDSDQQQQPQDEEEHTTIVYLPPQFKLRMAIFMSVMWISWSALLCYVFVGPIAVGRWLFEYVGIVAEPGKKIHDIYAYFIGGSAMILVGVLVKRVKSSVSNFSTFDMSHVLKMISWVFNFTVISISFGLIIPLILGLMLQFYLIIPCQHWGSRAPVIDVFSIYTNGLVCLTLAHGIVSVLPNQTLTQSLNRLKANGIRRFDLSREMKDVIGPIVLNGLKAILLPFSIALVQNCLDHDMTNQVRFLQMIYPTVLIGLVLYYFSNAFTKFGQRWSQSVREDHYLVGRVLHNNEDPAASTTTPGPS
ncbi:uncharacterized protein ATC70_005631 [Mucor velutinosus]|uniref:RING-type E3 ubiquitin transferase n=1 Tax=Mucor velutinosus TaxID=708070 RepID=A0AAN7DB60_9FUNG|nr:hypothetical protein ATC70_005631 [Mucor velutinosus]